MNIYKQDSGLLISVVTTAVKVSFIVILKFKFPICLLVEIP